VLYVFVMDPAVKGADYGVAKILAEAYPTEIMDLYRMYSGAFAAAGQTLLNLLASHWRTGDDGPRWRGHDPRRRQPARPRRRQRPLRASE
jgi:hypothetical protein